ncbi:hypothetical protein C8R42DRAFT_716106 [Lentinula raphanica]|nr:hypothetical protein C8R42DRAFT_716106 [Lentinula raphanica]
MVILSLSLLQMGLVTSVLAAPTSTAVGPVQPAPSKEIGAISSSTTQRFPRQPHHCPVAKVQRRNPGSPNESTMQYGDLPTETFFRRICQERSVYPEDRFFAYLVSLNNDDFRVMCSIVKTNVKLSEDLPETAKEAALRRIAEYTANPSNEKTKQAVVWWLDLTLFQLQCTFYTHHASDPNAPVILIHSKIDADAAHYSYKQNTDHMFEDYWEVYQGSR